MMVKKMMIFLITAAFITTIGITLFLSFSTKNTGEIMKISAASDGTLTKIRVIETDEKTGDTGIQSIYTVPSYYPSTLLEKLEEGVSVKIYSDDTFKLSSPTQNDAYWIEILQN